MNIGGSAPAAGSLINASEGLPPAFFTVDHAEGKDDDIVYTATVATRGPWSEAHQHGGPPAALLARAIERAFDSSVRVARLTVAFHKPIAIAAYRVKVESVREGKKAKIARAYLIPADAPQAETRPVASAEALLVRRAPIAVEGPSTAMPQDGMPRPDACEAFTLPFFTSAVGYHVAMETRLMFGRFGEGHMGLWMRMRVPLVPGETPSPIQRVACAGDSGNGVSVGVDVTGYTFLNPDVTIALAWEASGEWIGLDARTTFGDDGIGLADTRLLDARGPIGRGIQPLVLEQR